MTQAAPSRTHRPDSQLLIDGEWRDASNGAKTTLIDPTTEDAFAATARGTPEDAEAAVAAAYAAFTSGDWPTFHHEARAQVLFRIADLIEERAEDLALREAMDMGMPYRDFIHAIIPHCAGMFRIFGSLAMTSMDGGYRSSYQPDLRILTRREPLGVVAAITPFNFPFALSMSKIAPALAAGNTVVHKPSETTPSSAIAFAQITIDAGLPPGVYNLLTGSGREVGDVLTAHPDVHKVAFTGSTAVGQRVFQTGANSMKHLTMELGGKSPHIIFADADLDRAVQNAFIGIFWNKGEVCVAGSRLLVERAVYDEVIARLSALAANAKIGDPLESDTVIGPIATKGEFDKVMGYIEKGRSSARLFTGGNPRSLNGKGFFIEPTVFADAYNDQIISREEIFGPVISVMPFNTEDEALQIANDTPYGLAAGIQSGDIGRAIRLADKLHAGTIWLNTWHRFHPNAPFGGFKMSGFGREHGPEALESYTQYKSIWANLASA
ncbi:aldehyde dehydrogenase family protein [Pelagibius sp.]|uniref:aldehyde dehydrogenase family protein n=1 Tax=Pelagibius sp. TaxID=1931238 RepID=UPI003B51110B